ncbi:MAG: hypothetical protein KGZ68_02350 [Dechloromonas sp.]|jgi:hypothetical protein|nr:hypothetical protein [Dechloromonas sp.]
MFSISRVQGSAELFRSQAAQRTATAGPAAVSATNATDSVSISSAAREALKSEAAAKTTGIPLPQAVTEWFTKDFPADVIDEAMSRLAANKAQGALGGEGPLGLPLLPENQALLDGFREEMRSLSADGHANMNTEQSARFNLLMNLSMRVQMLGWKSPMSEADVQREFDISNAMARLGRENPDLLPATESVAADETKFIDVNVESVSAVWRERWAASGLEMPEVIVSPQRSWWLTMATAAGFDESEFMTAVRGLGQLLAGHELTRGVENLISERYGEKLAAEEAAGS